MLSIMEQEKPSANSSRPVSTVIVPWSDDVLDGRRFGGESEALEFDREAIRIAARATDSCLMELDAESGKELTESELARVSSVVNERLLDDICDPRTPWLSGPALPEKENLFSIRESLRNLLPPVSLPYSAMRRIGFSWEKPAIAASIGSFLGAVLGLFIGCFWDEKSIFGILIGGIAGCVLLIFCFYRLSESPKLRKRLLWGVGGIALLDLLISIYGFCTPAALLMPSSLAGGFALRLCCWTLVALFLYLANNDCGYHREQARIILRSLYCQRVQSLVMLLGLFDKGSHLNTDHTNLSSLRREMDQKQGEVDKMEKGMTQLACLMESVWKADIRRLPILLRQIARQLLIHKYELNCSDAPCFESQIPTDLPELEESEAIVRVLVWEDSLSEKYEPIEFVQPGDEVTVEKEPVIQDGMVVMTGIVIKKR